MWTDSEHERSMHLPLYAPPGDLTEERRALAEELSGVVEGEVRFDDGSRALYATDGSNYRQVPIGVVVPRNAADVIATMALCNRYGVPVLARGAGTSLAGQCCNVAVVMDMTKYMHHILGFDPERRLATVQPGCVLDNLRHEAQRRYGLTFGPDPSTHAYCSIGGMIGNDSCGVHAQIAGRMANNVDALEILTYDGLRLRVGRTDEHDLQRYINEGGRRGDIYQKLRHFRDRYASLIRERYPKIPRRVSGYNNLDQLLPENGFNVARALVGTEGTCVTIVEATLNLIHFGKYSTLVVLGYPDVYRAADHLPRILEFAPIGLEGMDKELATDVTKTHLHPQYLKLLPEGGGWLMVQFWGDTKDEADDQAHRLMEALSRESGAPSMRFMDNVEEMDHLWKLRESGLGATARIPGKPDAWPGWEDSAVAPEKVADYLRDLRTLFDKYRYSASLYGHFGQGCIHCRIPFDLKSAEGIRKYRSFIDEATDLVLSYGGSLSGEHGDGQSRAEFLPKMYGPELVEAFREFKTIWDPQGMMNPGKLVNPYRIDENLRFGADYHPAHPKTHFRFPDDKHDFLRATERCVGVGKCRREEEGIMCPSYHVTHEEKHTTRGRTHMLFEMLQHDVLEKGWKDEAVKESLDLCLSCKGCKTECPMKVDVATYKSEFLSHYYEGRLRPRSAYAFGLVYWWSRLASKVPRLANFFTHAPGLSALAKLAAGMPQERKIPAFATQTFKDWFFSRERKHVDGPRVLLWADTFNNHFHPEIAQAAVEVLEAAGFQVDVPKASLCCGRPLYDYGMLDLAKRQLRQIMRTLRTDIAHGTPIVGLEPSCVAVFRDELVNMYPDDPVAEQLSHQMLTLSEFLEKKAPHWQAPKLAGKAVVHGHCHHHAINNFKDEPPVVKGLGLETEVLDAGCCGMAGSFGFEKQHYDVSVGAGEWKLLPKVRHSDETDLIVADGFSCREQIGQLTDRRAVHLAQVLQLALRGKSVPKRPEQFLSPNREAEARKSATTALIGLVGATLATGLLWRWVRPAFARA